MGKEWDGGFITGAGRTELLLGCRASYAPGPGVRMLLSILALSLASSMAALEAAVRLGWKISAAGQGYSRGLWCLAWIRMHAPRRILGLEVHGSGHAKTGRESINDFGFRNFKA